MRRALVATLVAVLAAPLAVGPASAAAEACATSAIAHPDAAAPNAGTATARGMFLTYGDWDTVLEGGTLIPPDVSAPLAEASVDRTGLGSALAGQVYSPYNDSAGVLNTTAGTSLPAEGVIAPSRAQVSGRPPQEQALSTGAGCVRLAEGPIAEAATKAVGLLPGMAVRAGEVHSFTGPRGSASEAASSVILTDIQIGELLIEQVVLTAHAVADGAIGESAAKAVISGVTVAGEQYALTSRGLEPVSARMPDSAGLSAWGFEVLSAGTSGYTHSSNISRAWATGPMLRVTTDDGRSVTVILGQASVIAEHGQV